MKTSLRILPVALAALLPVLAVAQQPAARTGAARPAAGATAASGEKQPAAVIVEINTPDGLPLEVEVLSVHSGVAKVRSVASNREYELRLNVADKPTKAAIDVFVSAARQSIPRLSPGVALETNDGAQEKIRTIRTPIARAQTTNNSTEVGTGEAYPATRTIGKGGRALVFTRLSVPPNVPVDFPAMLHIFWFRRDGNEFAPTNAETVPFLMSDKPGEYISNVTSFGKDRDFAGYAAVLVNSATKQIVWDAAGGSESSAVRRIALQRVASGSTTTPSSAAKAPAKAADTGNTAKNANKGNTGGGRGNQRR